MITTLWIILPTGIDNRIRHIDKLDADYYFPFFYWCFSHGIASPVKYICYRYTTDGSLAAIAAGAFKLNSPAVVCLEMDDACWKIGNNIRGFLFQRTGKMAGWMVGEGGPRRGVRGSGNTEPLLTAKKNWLPGRKDQATEKNCLESSVISLPSI